LKQLSKGLFLFAVGGLLYYLIEILWRGYSHFSMFVLGGLCFILVGKINVYLEWNMFLWKQQIVAMIIITIAEFLAGLIVNVWLKLDVWNYSHLPFNFLGQICLYYSVLWFWLSAIAIVLDDWLRWKLFNEEKPYYKFM
jgi:uncharacterized membrane protein